MGSDSSSEESPERRFRTLFISDCRCSRSLALADLGADRGREARLVGVAGGEPAAVVDTGVVAVAAAFVLGLQRITVPSARGADRRPFRHGDVDALVHPPPAVAKAGGEVPSTGQIKPQKRSGGPGRQRSDASASPFACWSSAAESRPEDRRRHPRALSIARAGPRRAPTAFASRAAARSASPPSSWVRVRT